MFTDVREQNAVLNTRTQENLAGIRVVKAFAREDYEENMFLRDNQELRAGTCARRGYGRTSCPLMELMSGLCTPIMMAVGGAPVLGPMDLGTLIAITGYISPYNQPHAPAV